MMPSVPLRAVDQLGAFLVDLIGVDSLHHHLVFPFLHIEDMERQLRSGSGRGELKCFHGDRKVKELVLADDKMPEHAGRDWNLRHSGGEALDIDLDRLHGRLFLGLLFSRLPGRSRSGFGLFLLGFLVFSPFFLVALGPERRRLAGLQRQGEDAVHVVIAEPCLESALDGHEETGRKEIQVLPFRVENGVSVVIETLADLVGLSFQPPNTGK